MLPRSRNMISQHWPPSQGPGPRNPDAKLARTPGPQRQIGPDPGPWAPTWTPDHEAFLGVWGAHDAGSRLCLRFFLRGRLDSRFPPPQNPSNKSRGFETEISLQVGGGCGRAVLSHEGEAVSCSVGCATRWRTDMGVGRGRGWCGRESTSVRAFTGAA